MNPTADVMYAMIRYYAGDSRRINHFIKVYGFASLIARQSGLAPDVVQRIEIAALVHDIGIKISEEKYHSSAGSYQELEGLPEARKMLLALGIEESSVDRISYLVSRHHTYKNIDGIDYQILVEADFLVNIYEEQMERPAIQKIRERIFKTEAGIALLKNLYFS